MRVRVLGNRSRAARRTAMRCVRDDTDPVAAIQQLTALAGAPKALVRAAMIMPETAEYPISRARALLMAAAGKGEPPEALSEDERQLRWLWLLPPAEAFALLEDREPRLQAVADVARQGRPDDGTAATGVSGSQDVSNLRWLLSAATELVGPDCQREDAILRSNLALAVANRHLAGLIGYDVEKYDRPPYPQE